MKLFKTTVVIWSKHDPKEVPQNDEEDVLEILARDTGLGDAYCSKMESVLLHAPETDPDWDGNDFFQNEN